MEQKCLQMYRRLSLSLKIIEIIPHSCHCNGHLCKGVRIGILADGKVLAAIIFLAKEELIQFYFK